MGWLVSFLIALLIVSLLAALVPTLFGPLVAGVAPILAAVAAIGLGGLWWRSRRRFEAEASAGPSDGSAGDGPIAVRGEDDSVET